MVPTRRRLLATLAGSALLAGCSGSEETTPTAESTSTAPTDAPTAAVTTPVPTTAGVGDPQTTETPPRTTAARTPTPTPSADRPPYVDPDAFTEESVTLSAFGGCSLGGTLTVPTGSEPVPGVVIVHGSGPQDRNGTAGPLAPYADIAEGLSSNGIAVLRYDKRTAACTEALDPAALSVEDVVIDDAVAALDRLRGHERVAPDRTAVVGHSLGGALAPWVARADGKLAGVAMPAANARPLPTLVVEQTRRLFEQDGELTEDERANLEVVRNQAEAARTGTVTDGAVVFGAGAPFWRGLAEYDQVAAARERPEPLFLAQGGTDRQVPPAEDFARWRDALGNREDVRFERYPGANHFFVAGPSPTRLWSEPVRSTHVVEPLVADLAAWIGRVTASR